MRILMITDFYWPFVGGVEQHVRRLGQSLAARGHSVAVATLAGDGLAEREDDGQVRVHRLRSTTQRVGWLYAHRQRSWAPPFADPQVTRGLRQIIACESPEIVHGHDWLARSFLSLKAASRARLVISLHYYTLSCAKKSLIRGETICHGPSPGRCLTCAAGHYGIAKGVPVALANWVMAAAERAAVDMFLPVSQATAAGNGLTAGDQYQVIPNFLPDGAPRAVGCETYLSELPAEPFLLFVGDLRRAKGLDVLLAAYAGLAGAPPLVLIGKVWPDTPKHLPPHVRVFRDWPNEAVLAAWERCLVALVPSVWPEPFGMVVIEAMAAGRPVIASNTGGIPEIITDGETGLLVPPGEPAALRQAMAQLLGDGEQRRALGLAAQRQAARYRASAIVPRIEQVYAGLLGHRSEIYAGATSKHHYQQP